MTFKSIEDPLYEMLEELKASGEPIHNEGAERPNLFAEYMKKQQMQQMAVTEKPSPAKWICSCGTGNSGNFCCECGTARP